MFNTSAFSAHNMPQCVKLMFMNMAKIIYFVSGEQSINRPQFVSHSSIYFYIKNKIFNKTKSMT